MINRSVATRVIVCDLFVLFCVYPLPFPTHSCFCFYQTIHVLNIDITILLFILVISSFLHKFLCPTKYLHSTMTYISECNKKNNTFFSSVWKWLCHLLYLLVIIYAANIGEDILLINNNKNLLRTIMIPLFDKLSAITFFSLYMCWKEMSGKELASVMMHDIQFDKIGGLKYV